MKTCIVFSFIAFCVLPDCSAQFQRKIGSLFEEMPQALDVANGKIVSNHQGYVAGGMVYQSPFSSFLTRTDGKGNILWNWKYLIHKNSAQTIAWFADVKTFQLGTAEKVAMLGGSSSIAGTVGLSDMLFSVLDEFGAPDKSVLLGTTDYDQGLVMAKTTVGSPGFVIVGETHPLTNPNEQQWDIIMAVVDNGGNLLKSAVYQAPGRQHIYDVVQTNDGGFVMVGQTKTQFSCDADTMAALVMKVDTNLNPVWSNVMDIVPDTLSSRDWAFGVERAHGDNILVAGNTIASVTKPFLALLKDDGSIVWMKSYAISNGFVTFPQIQGMSFANRTFPDGNVENVILSTRATHQSAFMTMDFSGNPKWCRLYDYNFSGQFLTPIEMVVNVNEGLAFLGRTANTTDDLHLTRTNDKGESHAACEMEQILLVDTPRYCVRKLTIPKIGSLQTREAKLTADPLEMEIFDCDYNAESSSHSEQERSGLIYPNPSKDHLFISEQGYTQAIVRDLTGLVLMRVTLDEPHIAVSELHPGTYVLELSGKARKAVRVLFVKE